jgi:hypothetical membrane protein
MIARPPTASRAARLACIVASAGALWTSIIVVGAITPGYRPLADAVSRLGSPDEPHASLMRAGFVLFGLLVVAGAGALGEHASGKERPLACLIGGFGAAAIVAGLAPKDPPQSAHTLTSQIHVDATIVGGAMLLAAMALVARYGPRRTDRRIARTVGALTMLVVVVFPFTWGSAIYGLLELLLLALAVVWLVALALRASPVSAR